MIRQRPAAIHHSQLTASTHDGDAKDLSCWRTLAKQPEGITMESFIELRRHTARHHDEWGHLTQVGVELARRVGSTMGRFDLVISSPLPRAAETAIAMGYGIDQEIQEFAVVGETAMAAIDWPMGFDEFTRRMKPGTGIAQRGGELAALLLSIAQTLPDGGGALVLSHGAVIEMSTIAATPWIDHTAWGPHCGHCEGVRLTHRDGAFSTAEVLRVPGATGR